MQSSFLYQLNGSLTDGRYLPGVALFSAAANLVSAAVIVPLGGIVGSGVMVLELEVNGNLTGDQIVLNSASVYPVNLEMNTPVPDGGAVRWRSHYVGAIEDAPEQVQLVLQWELAGVATLPFLGLDWTNGSEHLPLYAYDPTTYLFTDISAGRAATRAVVDVTDGFSLFLQGVEKLRVRGGIFYADYFSVGPPSEGMPRVDFTVNGQAIAAVTPAGFFIPSLIEQVSLAVIPDTDPNYYQVFSWFNDDLVAWLGGGGLVVTTAVEGIA